MKVYVLMVHLYNQPEPGFHLFRSKQEAERLYKEYKQYQVSAKQVFVSRSDTRVKKLKLRTVDFS